MEADVFASIVLMKKLSSKLMQEIKDFKIGVYLRTAQKDDEEIKRQEKSLQNACLLQNVMLI